MTLGSVTDGWLFRHEIDLFRHVTLSFVIRNEVTLSFVIRNEVTLSFALPNDLIFYTYFVSS